MTKLSERKRRSLRKQYKKLPATTNKLQWCTDEGHKIGMSYGQFVTWLGI